MNVASAKLDPQRITGIEYTPEPGFDDRGAGAMSTIRYAFDFADGPQATPTHITLTEPKKTTNIDVPISADERTARQAIADAVRGSDLVANAKPLVTDVHDKLQLIVHTDTASYVVDQAAFWAVPRSSQMDIERPIAHYVSATDAFASLNPA